jgi:N-carbamoylputrescine amidase
LFEGPYFCRVEDESLFATAKPTAEHPRCWQYKLADELKIWIPTSFFELDGPHHYNSLAMIGPDGKVAGVYQEPHPDGPGYEEKFYFRPGNTGFKVWNGPYKTTLGVGVCWDQWYPETARAMMLMGADILFYPTAIGTEPHDPDLDTSRLWRRAMIGHAVSNVVPVVAANRIGTEHGQRFYGHSFICDERGDILAEFGAEETGVLVATLTSAAKTPRCFRLLPIVGPEHGRLVEDV